MKIKNDINPHVFREYDIRGVYPHDIDADMAYTFGLSYGSYLQENFNVNKVAIGYDNRLSSKELNDALVKGLLEVGCDIINIGLCTTPALYYARYKYNRPGIMITASHNPREENGFKFSFNASINAFGATIAGFKDYLYRFNYLKGDGSYQAVNDFNDEYVSFLQKNIKMGPRKLKIIVDCGNGTASILDEKVFNHYSWDIKYIYTNSDGSFPHHHPDPNVEANLSVLKETVLKENADVGVSFDGDEDRLGVINELGEFIPIDHLMIIFIRDIIKRVEDKTFLYDVKCSKSLSDEIEKLGGNPYCYRTGASYTQAKVIEDNLPFGGEYSGHIYFNDRSMPVLGSGFYAALRLLEILSNTNKQISELLFGINDYINIPEERIPCDDDIKFALVENIKNYCGEKQYPFLDIDGVRINLDKGWALIRASNTGPMLTVRFEAKTAVDLENIQKEFINIINEEKAILAQD